jgi:hypothetical protein
MDTLEIEVKFLLDDMPALQDRIIQLGGISDGPVFETNIRFERLKKECHLPFSDITFKNFEQFPTDIRDYRFVLA